MSPISDLLNSDSHAAGCSCYSCRARGAMSADELLRRAKRAAALELTGKTYNEDRANVAADIVLATLERFDPRTDAERAPIRVPRPRARRDESAYRRALRHCADVDAAAYMERARSGVMPQRDDKRVSLTACCDLAKTLRRSIDRQRARDRQAAEIEADALAASTDALAPAERSDAERDALDNLPTPAETFAVAVAASARLGHGTDAATVSLVYRSAREAHGLRGAAIAAELREVAPDVAPPSAKALDTRCARARKQLAAETDAASFLRRLTDGNESRVRYVWASADTLRTTLDRTRCRVLQRVEALTGSDRHGPYALARDFLAADMSRPAEHVSEASRERKAIDWRTRPDAPAPVAIKRTRTRTAKLAQRTRDEIDAARSRQADAERAASRR